MAKEISDSAYAPYDSKVRLALAEIKPQFRGSQVYVYTHTETGYQVPIIFENTPLLVQEKAEIVDHCGRPIDLIFEGVNNDEVQRTLVKLKTFLSWLPEFADVARFSHNPLAPSGMETMLREYSRSKK